MQQTKASTPASANAEPRPASAELGRSSHGIAQCLPSPLAQLAGQDHQQTGGPAAQSSPCDELLPAELASRGALSPPAVQKGTPTPAKYRLTPGADQ